MHFLLFRHETGITAISVNALDRLWISDELGEIAFDGNPVDELIARAYIKRLGGVLIQ